jgi:hypothetical protein
MKKVFQSIKEFVQRIFNKAFSYAKANAEVAVQIVQKFKELIDSPIADIAVALIPGDLDDKALAKVRQVLPEFVVKFAINAKIIQAAEDPTTALNKIREYIATLPAEGRGIWYAGFAAHFAEAISDGVITLPEAYALTQTIYVEFYKKEAA